MTCCASSPSALVGQKPPLTRMVLALFLAGNCMALSLAVNISALDNSERYWLHSALITMTLAVFSLVGTKLVLGVARAWRARAITIEAVFAVGILGASAYSLHAVWAGAGDVYFEVVCILLVIYTLSAEMKEASQQRTLSALRAALPSPKVATCVRPPGGDAVAIPVGDLVIGDHVVARAGELVPVDGEVLSGVALVNEATLTGEGFCARRSPGDRVRAGTRNVDGDLLICATSNGTSCELDVIAGQVMDGLSQRSALELEVDRAARWFFPIIMVVSALTFVGWWLYASLISAFLNAMAVLLVACPCALGFATPIGLWAAWVKLARLGLVARHTAGIERLAGADVLVFDKTGTLTHLQKAAGACKLMPGTAWTEDQATELACAAQLMSHHPIASAMTACAPICSASYRSLSVRLLPGSGIEVEMRSRSGQRFCVRLGDPERLAEPEDAAQVAAVAATARGDARALGLFVDGRAIAIFEIVERPVPGTVAALTRLSAMGLTCAILSGDTPARLQPWRVAMARGLLTATDKLRHVQCLAQQGHRVCFVGDGVNDAPAMAQSHVSLVVEDGSTLAKMVADLTLAQADLAHLPEAIAIARKAIQVVRSNLALAAVYNALGVALAAAGMLHPVWAAVLMLCSSFTVTWRASAWKMPEPPRPSR